MGVEPSSPCAQLEHLADLLRNRVYSQRNPSLYEVWRPKTVEDTEKQTVRLPWDGKVAGICARPSAAVALAWHLTQDNWKRVRSPATSPTRAGRAAQHQEGPGSWKSLGEIEMKWETHRGDVHLLGLWTPAPEQLGCWETPGEGRRVEPCQTLTWILSRLVRKLGCVKSLVLVKNGRQLLCKELETSGWLARG